VEAAAAKEDVAEGEVGEVGEQDKVGWEEQEAGALVYLRPKQILFGTTADQTSKHQMFGGRVLLVVAAAFVAAEAVPTLNAGFLTQWCAVENFRDLKIRIASCLR